MAHPKKDLYQLDEPTTYQGKDVIGILNALERKGGFNDIVLATGRKIYVKVDGKPMTVTDRTLTNDEVSEMLHVLTRDTTAPLHLAKGYDIDDSVSIQQIDENGEKIRGAHYIYRLRADAFSVPLKGRGIAITLRAIDLYPPLLSDINFPEEIADSLMPMKGMVLVCGETGSGKSTSLASSIRHYTTNPDNDGQFILTFEEPIEYLHTYECANDTLIIQTSVDSKRGDAKSFKSGLRGALRRSPESMLVGELRDAESVDIAMQISSSGHLCLGTIHANSIAAVFERVANYYPAEVQEAKTYQLLNNIKTLLVQYLATKVSGGRVLIYEWLVFTTEVKQEIVEQINQTGIDNLTSILADVINRHGVNMKSVAQKQFNGGIISELEYKKILKGI
ncbi:MAG: Flp pilus assembly complex ATPase component TadA [Endozoicomonadaceae bacterium]|nr:Flp pilus assembly complex ATPase component TadA [Endozoicomonadaceae bacterium]